MLFDTEFLICASGHRGRRQLKRAEEYLTVHRDAPLYTSRVCWAEFAEGCDTPETVERLLARFAVIEIGEHVGWSASRIGRTLKTSGEHIGDNDVWIAATALTYDLPLVGNNVRHFRRLPGLDVRPF